MYTEAVPGANLRNNRALFLSPLLAAAIVFIARFAVGLQTEQQPSLLASAFWAAMESASYCSVWLPVGWVLAWAAWRLRLHQIPRRLLAVALVITLAAFVVIATGSMLALLANVPREGATVILGLALNLGVFLLLQE